MSILLADTPADIQSGQLGSRRGARYRTYERLQDFLRHREGDLFRTDAVRAAIQAIYDHPLTTEAVDKLNRQLRSGISASSSRGAFLGPLRNGRSAMSRSRRIFALSDPCRDRHQVRMEPARVVWIRCAS